MLYDQATRKKAPKLARKLAKLPRVVRPGVSETRNADTSRAEEYAAVDARAQESGTLDDLTASFLARERHRAR